MGQLGDLSPGGSIAIGIFVGLVSTSVQSLGLTLQRKSHILEDEKDPHELRRPPHRRRRWQLGMAMFIVSNILGSTIQITTLPLPVLSTLQASGLVFNSICAALILGEPFTRWSLGGTLLVCAGAVLIAIFGAIAEPAHSLEQLLRLLGRRPFVIWMIWQAIIIVALIFTAEFLGRIKNAASPQVRLFRGFTYGIASGILSAHSLLVAKSAVELLVRTIIDQKNQFDRWQSWVILIGLLVLALTQLFYLHQGLKLVSTSVLYPLVFCVYNVIAILDGLIYFNQTDRLSAAHGALVAVGTVILLAGVLALSWRLTDEQSPPSAAKQSALAPGLGFVEDTEEEEEDQDDYYDSTPDEEALAALAISDEPMTPTTKLDTVLGATRSVRKPSRLTEAAEIWGELEDATSIPTTPRARSFSVPTSQQPERAETMPLLRSPSGRRRPRRHTGFPGFMPRQPSSSHKRHREPQQRTWSNLWKMRWWGKRDDKKRTGVGRSSAGYGTVDTDWPQDQPQGSNAV